MDWSLFPVIFSLVIYHAFSSSWSVVISIFSLISVMVFLSIQNLWGVSSMSKTIIPHFPHNTLRNLLIGQLFTDCSSAREQSLIGHSIHCFFMIGILTKKYVLDIVSRIVYKHYIQQYWASLGYIYALIPTKTRDFSDSKVSYSLYDHSYHTHTDHYSFYLRKK